MRSRRLATAGVALVAALGLGLTGCGNQSGADDPAANGNAAPATSAPADPRAALNAAALKLNEQSVRMKIESSVLKGDGVLDPKTMTAEMTMTAGGGTFGVRTVGDDSYLKISGVPGASKNWLHVNTAALSENSQLSVITKDDPVGANKLVKSVVDVQKTGEGTYAGTMDYTRTVPNDKDIQALGDKAKAVPFTAKVDAEGRLTEMTVDTSVLHESLGKMVTTYSDFGTAVKVAKPAAGETEEAPEELIKALNG
ncbi:hypothetical protein [Micromonospora sp. WMMD812]|uniref:hypothetical protein n=1 Tax=Micromonospora sp. WMMD812 TaxID=3015152 RepID=UPI00248B5473|nr:hypothetical protein [Micromonospora sp. WMMD812]WBB66659.1 hypothetical protein O7603_26485 [Micromonospora sp. WMMD812]